MADQFDPWQQWLGISPKHQPADHYRLLGLSRFESDTDVIANAAERAAELVRHKAGDEYAEESGRLLKALAEARTCLLDSKRKAAYDRALKRRRLPRPSEGKPTPPLPRPRALDTPPFKPAPPPHESGAPPVQGEPPPPPVAGEPVSQPRPALHPGDLPHTPQPPALRAEPPVLQGSPPVLQGPPPVVQGQPAATPPQPPPLGAETTTPEPPPVATVADDQPTAPDTVSLPVKPLASPPAQRAETAANTAPSSATPQNVPQGKKARRPLPLPYTRSQPAPEETDVATEEATDKPGTVAASPSQDRPSSKPAKPSRKPATKKRQPGSPKQGTAPSPPTDQRPARPIAVASAHGQDVLVTGEVGEDTPSRPTPAARPKRLPWAIILPAAGIVVAIAVSAVVLLGGFGTAQDNPADGKQGADATDVPLDDDEGSTPVDRDAEGSIAAATPAGDAGAPDASGESEGSRDAVDSQTGPEATPAADAAANDSTDPKVPPPAEGITTGQTMASDTQRSGGDTGSQDSSGAGTTNGETPPAEPPKPPPPPPNPFRELPKLFDLAAATTAAEKAARNDPLNPKAGQIRIGKVHLASGQPLSLRLLGGKSAVPGNREFKLQPVFSLEEDSRWAVNLVEEPDAVIAVGRFTFVDGNLVYDWVADDDVRSTEYLQNCVLDAWTGDHRHMMPLRRPEPAKEVPLELHLNEFQDSIPVTTLPDASSLRLEVVRVTGTGQSLRMPANPSIRLDESMLIDLLDKNRNAKASLRITCEGAHAGRVRFRVNPMARATGGTPVTMGIQTATSQVNKLRKEKEAIQNRIKAIDAQLPHLQGPPRELADKTKHSCHIRIREIDQAIGKFDAVLALLKPLHQKASLQMRVVMNADGQDVVLAAPAKGK